MANISVRGVGEQALRKLKQTAKRRGTSLNRLITDMLNGEAGGSGGTRAVEHSDLDHLAGTWQARDAREFERATATFKQVDEDLWR
jgi:fermentation-respiration switch protein FrsA (DUF1100 family)